MRLNSSARQLAKARASSVLAVPGTPSSSTWPSESNAAIRSSTASSCPITTRWTCSFRRSATARTSVSSMQDLFAEAVDAAGEREHRRALGAARAVRRDGGVRRGGELAQLVAALRAEPAGDPFEAGRPLERARRAVVLGEPLDRRVEV